TARLLPFPSPLGCCRARVLPILFWKVGTQQYCLGAPIGVLFCRIGAASLYCAVQARAALKNELRELALQPARRTASNGLIGRGLICHTAYLGAVEAYICPNCREVSWRPLQYFPSCGSKQDPRKVFKPRATRQPITEIQQIKDSIKQFKGKSVRLWDYCVSHSELQLLVAHSKANDN